MLTERLQIEQKGVLYRKAEGLAHYKVAQTFLSAQFWKTTDRNVCPTLRGCLISKPCKGGNHLPPRLQGSL